MIVARGIHCLPHAWQNAVVTIGNYDGIHRGHQAVIAMAKQRARQHKRPLVAIIFEPHPIDYFKPQESHHRLMSLREKVITFAQYGVNNLLVMRFCYALAMLSADEFVQQLLVDRLAIRHCVVGHDFCYGRARQGDSSHLVAAANSYAFGCDIVPAYTFNQIRVSSTYIRRLIAAGDVQRAHKVLGHAYMICGRVQHGNQMGRRLGYPTANIVIDASVKQISKGIYVVTAIAEDATHYPAVASIGVRPAVVDNGPVILEVHCLDIPWVDFYDQKMQVMFHRKLRDESDFSCISDLVSQMGLDCQLAREYFDTCPEEPTK